jgi:hypothetical protein
VHQGNRTGEFPVKKVERVRKKIILGRSAGQIGTEEEWIRLPLPKEDRMRTPVVDDFVRLTRDIPELSLHRGQVGVVRSTWCSPLTYYEVEFHEPGLDHDTRALVMAEQLQVQEEFSAQEHIAAAAGNES